MNLSLLKALINFVNEFILPKAATVVGKDVKIVFDREINTCKYYEKLVSADPLAVARSTSVADWTVDLYAMPKNFA